MDKEIKKTSKAKFQLKFTSEALDKLKEPGTNFEELATKFEFLGIKFEQLRTKFEELGIKVKKKWTKFKAKLNSSSSSQKNTIQNPILNNNLDDDDIYVVDYVNGNYEIYHHYEKINYDELVSQSTINLLEDSYGDTFESQTRYENTDFSQLSLAASATVNAGASCSKIGNAEKKVPPPVPQRASEQSIYNYHKHRNVNHNSNNNGDCYLPMNGNNSKVDHYEKMSFDPLQSQNKCAFPISSINSSDHYYDTPCDSFESQTRYENTDFSQLSLAASATVNAAASCSKIGNAEKKIPPVVPPRPLSRNASFSKVPPVVPPRPLVRNASFSQTSSSVLPKPLVKNTNVFPKNIINSQENYYKSFESQINHRNASFSKAPLAIAPKPKKSHNLNPFILTNDWDEETTNNINNCQSNSFESSRNRQSLRRNIGRK